MIKKIFFLFAVIILHATSILFPMRFTAVGIAQVKNDRPLRHHLILHTDEGTLIDAAHFSCLIHPQRRQILIWDLDNKLHIKNQSPENQVVTFLELIARGWLEDANLKTFYYAGATQEAKAIIKNFKPDASHLESTSSEDAFLAQDVFQLLTTIPGQKATSYSVLKIEKKEIIVID